MATRTDSQVKRLTVVVFDGTPLGIMSFTIGVFDMAKHDGVLPDLDLRVVAGEPAAATRRRQVLRHLPDRQGGEHAADQRYHDTEDQRAAAFNAIGDAIRDSLGVRLRRP